MNGLRVQCDRCKQSVEPKKALRISACHLLWWCLKCFREAKRDVKRVRTEGA